MNRSLLGLLLAACAHAPAADGPPETEVAVLDEAGEPLLGNVSFWSRNRTDECTVYGSSCAVSLPTGDYSFTFRKERAGRTGSSIGGMVPTEKLAGCLRSRVHVTPGQKIVCKKTGEFNCARGAYETMDCGNSAAVRYGYKARPGDEPPEK
jgi:hypothetical protein